MWAFGARHEGVQLCEFTGGNANGSDSKVCFAWLPVVASKYYSEEQMAMRSVFSIRDFHVRSLYSATCSSVYRKLASTILGAFGPGMHGFRAVLVSLYGLDPRFLAVVSATHTEAKLDDGC